MYEYKLERRVAFSETDQAGIVHFSNFYRYFEEAEAGLFRALDLGGLADVWGGGPGGIGWVRLSAEMEFLNPARLDDLLTVHVWIAAKNSRSLKLGCRVWREGTLIAQGWMRTMCVTIADGRPSSCCAPPEIEAALTVAPWGETWPPEEK